MKILLFLTAITILTRVIDTKHPLIQLDKLKFKDEQNDRRPLRYRELKKDDISTIKRKIGMLYLVYFLFYG